MNKLTFTDNPDIRDIFLCQAHNNSDAFERLATKYQAVIYKYSQKLSHYLDSECAYSESYMMFYEVVFDQIKLERVKGEKVSFYYHMNYKFLNFLREQRQKNIPTISVEDITNVAQEYSELSTDLILEDFLKNTSFRDTEFKVLALRIQGYSISEICNEHKYSRQYIHRILDNTKYRFKEYLDGKGY